jgi:hypothetical protein
MTPNKKRNLHRYQQKIAALIGVNIKVSVTQNPAFVVGGKNEVFPIKYVNGRVII